MMMHKLLIIDDEPIVREGLQKIIPWEDYGYKLCDIGLDGRDGLNKIRYHQPNLVLIDIRMPGFSGIDVIQQIKNEGYFCKFIILTGYSSFSYAKESIKLGISSYLLKPIDENELILAIEDVSTELTQEESIHKQLLQYKQMSEEQTLKKLFDGNWSNIQPDIIKKLENHTFQVAVILNEVDSEDYQLIVSEVKQYNNKVKLIKRENLLNLLFIDLEESKIKSFLNKVIYNPVMLGRKVYGYKEIPESYYQAKQLIDVHFCFSTEQFLTYEWLECKETHIPPKERNYELISRYMEFNDYGNIKKELMKLEAYYQSKNYPRELMVADIIDFTVSIISTIQKKYSSVEVLSKDVFVAQVFEQNNLQEIIALLYSKFENISKSINIYSNSTVNTIEKIKDYIDQYFYEEELNLKILAELFNYNSAYLGKKFKKQTGKTFHMYLDKVRIDNAKQKLAEGKYKVYEISEQVGYRNYDYFYIKFKKYVGISPKEYQKKYYNPDKTTDMI